MPMPTNLAIDDELILAAQKAGGHRTKKAAVTAALEEDVRRRRQLELQNLFGKAASDELQPAIWYCAAKRSRLRNETNLRAALS